MSNVQTIVQRFVADIENAIRAEVAAGIETAIAQALRRNGRSLPASRAGRAGGRPPKGAKRSPDEIARMTAQLLKYIASHPGERSEQIAKGLGTSTGELVLPIRKLLAAKSIRAKGKARGTTYTAAG